MGTQSAALKSEIEMLRAEHLKHTKKVDKVSLAHLKEKSVQKPFSWVHRKPDAKIKFNTGLRTVVIFN